MTQLIAEIGVNWDGDFQLLEKIISSAKKVGCQFVKFQSFNEEIIKGHPLKNRLIKSSVSKDNIEQINTIAKSIGIEWFCTPMYLEAVDLLEPYVKRYKIREFDGRQILNDNETELFKKIKKTDKEIIISTNTSPKNSKFFSDPLLKFLYCVPKYPCSMSELDFSDISSYHGYSNHCPKILAPLVANILGADILEVHVTDDKNKDFVDNPVSFDFNELGQLIDNIHDVKKITK